MRRKSGLLTGLLVACLAASLLSFSVGAVVVSDTRTAAQLEAINGVPTEIWTGDALTSFTATLDLRNFTLGSASPVIRVFLTDDFESPTNTAMLLIGRDDPTTILAGIQINPLEKYWIIGDTIPDAYLRIVSDGETVTIYDSANTILDTTPFGAFVFTVAFWDCSDVSVTGGDSGTATFTLTVPDPPTPTPSPVPVTPPPNFVGFNATVTLFYVVVVPVSFALIAAFSFWVNAQRKLPRADYILESVFTMIILSSFGIVGLKMLLGV